MRRSLVDPLRLGIGAACALAWMAISPPCVQATTDGIWSAFIASGLPSSEQALVATDPIERKLYLFGPRTTPIYGDNNNQTYVLDMGIAPPRFQRLSVVGPPPAPRFGAALVFDPLRRRLLLIGGSSLQASITTTEVWELTLDDPPRWNELEPLGPVPGPRTFSVAVYDGMRDRVLVYGGARQGGGVDYSLSDAWALDLTSAPAWSELTTAGAEPPALAGAAGVYDSRRDRLLIYGGGVDSDARNPRHDLWELSLSATPTWSFVPADGIPPASLDYDGSYDAAYDSTADRLYIVSSRFLDQDSLRTLAVSGIDLGAGGHWESVSATGADPGPRFEAAVALLGRELVCIAGRTDTGLQSDAHSLDLDARVWSDLTPIGTGPPTNLTWATAALDSAGARVFVLGGIPSELWTLRLEPTAAWQRVAVTGAGPTAVPIVWDSGGRRLLAVDCGAEPTAQVWALTPDSLPAWSLLETSNPGPVNRGDAAVAFDPRRHRLLVFGGHGTAVYGDLWQLHLDAVPTWDTLPPLFPLYRAKLAYDETRDQLVLFGGYVSQGGLISYPVWVNQTWVRPLDADDQPWASVVASGVPPADLENFVRDPARDRFLYAPSSSSEVWSLVLGPTPAWMPLHPPAVPSGLIVGGPAVMDGARGRLLFPLRSSLGGSELQFTPGVPGLMCPAVGAWSPGSIRDVSFGLVDSEGLELSYEYTLTCQRDWPGFPIRGLASTGGFSTEYVPIHIPIPDSAAFGAVQFGLLVTSREQSGLDTACSFELSGESAPVVPLGGDAEPDRVVVRWRTTRPELTVTIVRRGEGGPWTAVSRQAVVTPGVISYQDHGIQTDQRYYYRAEISDSTSGGAYAQIRVDVPQWSLGFADDQPNPARGQFSVQCSVPAQGPVELDVFDVTGRRSLGTTRVASGPGRLTFDVDGAGRMSPGMYFLRLTQGNQSRRKAIVFLR